MSGPSPIAWARAQAQIAVLERNLANVTRERDQAAASRDSYRAHRDQMKERLRAALQDRDTMRGRLQKERSARERLTREREDAREEVERLRRETHRLARDRAHDGHPVMVTTKGPLTEETLGRIRNAAQAQDANARRAIRLVALAVEYLAEARPSRDTSAEAARGALSAAREAIRHWASPAPRGERFE